MSATTLRYSKLVKTDLANNAVNLAGAQLLGHRVTVQMPVDDMNRFFRWQRQVGSDRPIGHFVGDGVSGGNFSTSLLASLSKVYNDVDGVSNGLNFSSAILDANTDSRIRKGAAVTANDLIMAYVLYKCYGSSATPTKSVIYNLEDAQEMLSNVTLEAAIETSFRTEENLALSAGVNKGAVDAMFRDLLATDPMRFFTPNGNQIPGLFETNADVASSGSWNLVENDKIEVSVEFKFTNPVTRRGVLDPSQQMGSPANTDATEQIIIPSGSTFNIRLQILATDTPQGSAEKDLAYAEQVAAEATSVLVSKERAEQAAATAAADAEQARMSASIRIQQVRDAYILAVNVKGDQEAKVAAAEAAAKAAAASLAAAIAQGSLASPADIQTARAKTVAADALVVYLSSILANTNAKITNYVTDIQNAQQDLAEFQRKSSAFAASLSDSMLSVSNALQTKAAADAALAAARVAAGISASDPLTANTTDGEAKALDSQRVVDAGARRNEAAAAFAAAQLMADAATAAAVEAKTASDAAQAVVDSMVAAGASLSSIQMQKAAAVSKLALYMQAAANKEEKDKALSVAQLTLGFATASLHNARQQAAHYSWVYSMFAKNELTIKLAADQASAAAALATYTAAAATAAAAQAELNSAVNTGAIASEVVAKRAAVLAANTAFAIAKEASDAANARVAKDLADMAKISADITAARDALIALGGTDPSPVDLVVPEGGMLVPGTTDLVTAYVRYPELKYVYAGNTAIYSSFWTWVFVDKGVYSATTPYTMGDLVTYGDSVYLSLKISDPRGPAYSSIAGKTPYDSSPYWLLVSTSTPPPPALQDSTITLLMNDQFLIDNQNASIYGRSYIPMSPLYPSMYWICEPNAIIEYFDTEERSPGGLFNGVELKFAEMPGTTFTIQGHALFTTSLNSGVPCMIFNATSVNFDFVYPSSGMATIVGGKSILGEKITAAGITGNLLGYPPGNPLIALYNAAGENILPVDLSDAYQITLATNGDQQWAASFLNDELIVKELRCDFSYQLRNAQLDGVSLVGYTLYGRGVPPGTTLYSPEEGSLGYDTISRQGHPSGDPLTFVYTSNDIDHTQINGTFFILGAKTLIEGYPTV